jgi:RNA polymerase sigma-70 factor (ECF subfamily)
VSEDSGHECGFEREYDKLADEALMALVAQGRREAFTVLVGRHQAGVMGVAYRFVGQRDVAEDIAQDVFLKVWRSASAFRPEAQFTTWLYRLTANLCWDRRRRAAREARFRIAFSQMRTASEPPSNLDSQERVERVRRAVARLPDRQRLAVILHRYAGLSHREIAEVTGWSVKAVESCLVRGYGALRKWLAQLDPRRANQAR